MEEKAGSMIEQIFGTLSNRRAWGPLLVVIALGPAVFVADTQGQRPLGFADYSLIGMAFLMMAVGIVVIIRDVVDSSLKIEPLSGGQDDDAGYVVRQLSRNFEILRAQTNQGFLLSGGFMAVGLAVIVTSLFGESVGFKLGGVKEIGFVAGIMTEFVAGTALVLYRLNFSRLNQTSDRLDDAWRVLAAHKLTAQLPDEDKAQATLQLIAALTNGRGGKSTQTEEQT